MKGRLSRLPPAPTDIEQSLWESGHSVVCGTDEVGRGPLAGPVVSAAVVLRQWCKPIKGVLDSKRLSRGTLEAAEQEIKSTALFWSIGEASSQEIDKLNILNASLLSMKRAVIGLECCPDYILVDGNQKIKGLDTDQMTVVSGDSLSASIAAASILAKVERDRIMTNYHQLHPEYGWDRNAGYPVREHLSAIKSHGITPLHRASFRPCRQAVEDTQCFLGKVR